MKKGHLIRAIVKKWIKETPEPMILHVDLLSKHVVCYCELRFLTMDHRFSAIYIWE